MSLFACAEPGALIREYKPKDPAPQPASVKKDADAWDFADDDARVAENQDRRAGPVRAEASDDDGPRTALEKTIKPASSYTDWKLAQMKALSGKTGDGKRSQVETVKESDLPAPGELTREPADDGRRGGSAKAKGKGKKA